MATVWHFLGGLEKEGWFYQILNDRSKRAPETGPWVAVGMLLALGLLLRVFVTGASLYRDGQGLEHPPGQVGDHLPVEGPYVPVHLFRVEVGDERPSEVTG